MAILSLIGSKGGVGTSLVATNLGCALASSVSTVLIDLHAGSGVDDLLLDSSVDKAWTELLTVLDELKPKHIDLATGVHSSGLKIMRGPEGWEATTGQAKIPRLVQTLADSFDWCLVDLTPGISALSQSLFSISDVTLLVTSADPPALRSVRRVTAALPPDYADRVGLILNQINRQHPSTAEQIAESIGLPLLAALPPDPRAVGYQVHFGHACVLDRASKFGRGIRELASRLRKSAEGQMKTIKQLDQGKSSQ